MWPGRPRVARPPELLASLRRVFGAPLKAPAPLPGDPGPPEPPTLISRSPRISFLHPKFRSSTSNFFPIPQTSSQPPRSPPLLPPHFALKFLIPCQIQELSLPPSLFLLPSLSPLQAQNPHLSQGPPGPPSPTSALDQPRSGLFGNLQCPTPHPFPWRELPSTVPDTTQSPGGPRPSAGHAPPLSQFLPSSCG